MSLLHKGNMTDRSVFVLLFSVKQPGCERENALSRFSKKHPVCFCLSIVFCGVFVVVCLRACFLFPGWFCHTVSCWCKCKSDGLEVLTWEFFRSYSTPPPPPHPHPRHYGRTVKMICHRSASFRVSGCAEYVFFFSVFKFSLCPSFISTSAAVLQEEETDQDQLGFAKFFSPCLGDLLQFLPLREVICVEEQQLLRPSQWCGNLA